MNYYGMCRSNYFLVKDPAAFEAWAEDLNLDHNKASEPGETKEYYMIGSSDGSGWPNYRVNDESGEDDEIDFLRELSYHLEENQVAVLMEIGHEGLRYLIGHACAVNSQGKIVDLDLNEIYKKAAENLAGPDVVITEAQY